MKEGKIYDIATTHSKEDIIAHFLNPHYAMSQGWINCKLRKVQIIVTVIELDTCKTCNKYETCKDCVPPDSPTCKLYKRYEEKSNLDLKLGNYCNRCLANPCSCDLSYPPLQESQKDLMIRFAKHAKNYKSSRSVEEAYESFMINEKPEK